MSATIVWWMVVLIELKMIPFTLVKYLLMDVKVLSVVGVLVKAVGAVGVGLDMIVGVTGLYNQYYQCTYHRLVTPIN